MSQADASSRLQPKAALLAGLAGGDLAAVINGILFVVGSVSEDVLVQGRPIALGQVVVSSILPLFLAGGLLAALARRPGGERRFGIAAAVLTILSLALPFTLPNAPGSMILTLLVMHLVAGGIAVFVVPCLAAVWSGPRSSAAGRTA